MSSPASDHNLLIGIPALGERRSCLTPLPVRSPTDRRARHFSQEGHQFTAKGPSPAEATGGQRLLKPALAAPSAGRRLGDGGDGEPAGRIVRPSRVGKNGGSKTGGLNLGTPPTGIQPWPWRRSRRRRTCRGGVRR